MITELNFEDTQEILDMTMNRSKLVPQTAFVFFLEVGLVRIWGETFGSLSASSAVSVSVFLRSESFQLV